MQNGRGTSNYSTPVSAGTGVSSDSIENCVRLIGTAKAHQRRHKSAPAGIAIFAVLLFFFIELAGGRFFHKPSRSVDGLPDNFDVLVLGSSVIATPLINYEFRNFDSRAILERSPITEMPKVGRLLSSRGAPEPVVYNASAHGESLETTDKFLQRSLERGKRPRLIALFVYPGSLVATDNTQRSFPANLQLFRNVEGLHQEARKKLSVSTWSAYSKLQFPDESRSNYWERVQAQYRKTYSQELSERKFQVLDNILKTCRSHSIKTLVVSTPLAACNRSLMSAGFYDRYSRTMGEIVRKNQGAETIEDGGFIDLGQSPDFIEGSDFHDPVHCNAKACEKMLRVLAPRMVQLLSSNEH